MIHCLFFYVLILTPLINLAVNIHYNIYRLLLPHCLNKQYIYTYMCNIYLRVLQLRYKYL